MAKSYIPHYQPAEDKAKELCKNAKTQQEKFDILTKWLGERIDYDGIRALHLRELLGPDIKRCWEKKQGICMDIACLTACMFRAVGMAANVVFGNATAVYTMHTDYNGDRVYKYGPTWHAWNQIFVDKKPIMWDQMIDRRNVGNTPNKLWWSGEYKVSHIRK